MKVNGPRLRADLESLAQIGRNSDGGIDRTALSAADAAARTWYESRCQEAGLELRCDKWANIVAGAADSWDRPAVWSGSHLDTVPDGGALDGALGVVAALECVRRITEEHLELAHPVQAVVFADEEGNYSHLFGSYGLVRGYSNRQLATMTGREGDTLTDALRDFSWRTAERFDPGRIRHFVELHIEQGPILEQRDIPIGVVTSIVGLGGAQVVFTGRADHAGTTPMTMRRDPGRAAGAFLTRLADIAASIGDDTVITCGRFSFEPGASNVVPDAANLALDFRAPTSDQVEALARALSTTADECASAHNVECAVYLDQPVSPVALDAEVRDIIRAAAVRNVLPTMDIPSGAGHDAQNMSQIAPTGMIFVPSHAGRSHSRFEHTDPQLLENGANVLLETLVSLAR